LRVVAAVLVIDAIVLWNTVYLEPAVQALTTRGYAVDESLLQHLSPLGWDHIALTGDYTSTVITSITDAFAWTQSRTALPPMIRGAPVVGSHRAASGQV
jgi:hypothetical protein